jgi:type I restriction enzyme, S subunit
MTSAWQTIAIKDLGRIVTGRTPSSNNPEHFGNGYPFITPSDISLDNRHIETERHVSEEGKESLERILLPKGAVCFVCIGATIGKICVTSRPSFTNQQINSVIVDESKHDSRFAFYALSLQGSNAKSLAGGAATPIINKSAFSEIEIDVPSLPTQRKIAGILSAYDDLIENNLRRIKILEQMAQSLYREWFVHFRFPGHESVKCVDSPLGQIPKGWEVKKLGQVTKIVMGLSPKGDTYNDQGDGIALVNGPVEFSERFTKRIKWTTSPTKTCKAGDLVVCVRGSTTGKNVKSDGEYCLGRGVCSISSEHQSFVDQMFANELPTLLGMTSGSTFPSWTGPVLQSHLVISPPKTLVAAFDRMALPMSDAIQSLAFKNDNLRRTRDLLLPKLLQGQH